MLKKAVWDILREGAGPVERFDRADGLPGTLAVAFPGLRGDALAVALDRRVHGLGVCRRCPGAVACAPGDRVR